MLLFSPEEDMLLYSSTMARKERIDELEIIIKIRIIMEKRRLVECGEQNKQKQTGA